MTWPTAAEAIAKGACTHPLCTNEKRITVHFTTSCPHREGKSLKDWWKS